MGNVLNAWIDHVANSRTIEEFEEIVAKEREKLTISNIHEVRNDIMNCLGYTNGVYRTVEREE